MRIFEGKVRPMKEDARLSNQTAGSLGRVDEGAEWEHGEDFWDEI